MIRQHLLSLITTLYQINSEMLYDALPENIDDLDHESEYRSDSDTEFELEEGEIRT